MALRNVLYNAPNVKACLSLLSPEISACALKRQMKREFGMFENFYKRALYGTAS